METSSRFRSLILFVLTAMSVTSHAAGRITQETLPGSSLRYTQSLPGNDILFVVFTVDEGGAVAQTNEQTVSFF